MGKIQLSDVVNMVSGKNRNQQLEVRLYTSSVLMSIVISLVFWGVNFLIDLDWQTNVLCGFSAVSLGWLYYEARYKMRYYKTTFIVITLLSISLSWILNGGITGSGNYIFILALVIYFSITAHNYHRGILALVLFVLVGLHGIALFKPEWVHSYESVWVQKLDLALTFFVVTIFVGLVYHLLYINYEEEKYMVEVQMTEIELQHKYMKESIHYARDIQQGYLQKKESVRKYFKEYFIFWRPKDIVSGDFYIIKSPKDDPEKVIVAVSDCTGHGVPGAFLTMLGMAFFNEIILQNGNIQPNEILNQMRDKVKFSLSQGRQASENRDGMDMVVCTIDKKNKTLQYAGSNRSVYIARNNKTLEFKGDRMPIGVHVNDKVSFTNHTVNLEDDDAVYLFSDGYADQYGGPNERKYFISKFKSFLAKNSNLKMIEQGRNVKRNFDDWKGDIEQTDDVLVVGFKPLAT